MIRVFYDKEAERVWVLRVVFYGDGYGINLTHDEGRPLVEFWSPYNEHADLGQFVSRYYVETLVEGFAGRAPQAGQGLCLQGGVPAWNVSGPCMDRIRTWLRGL